MNVVHHRRQSTPTFKRRHVIVRQKLSHAVREEAELLTDLLHAVVRGMGMLASIGQVAVFKSNPPLTEAEALHEDWVKVGGDMRRAIRKVKHEETVA